MAFPPKALTKLHFFATNRWLGSISFPPCVPHRRCRGKPAMVRTIQQVRARWYCLTFRQPFSVLLPHQSLDVALNSLSGGGRCWGSSQPDRSFPRQRFGPLQTSQPNHHRFTSYIQPRPLAQEASWNCWGSCAGISFCSASAAGTWNSMGEVFQGPSARSETG